MLTRNYEIFILIWTQYFSQIVRRTYSYLPVPYIYFICCIAPNILIGATESISQENMLWFLVLYPLIWKESEGIYCFFWMISCLVSPVCQVIIHIASQSISQRWCHSISDYRNEPSMNKLVALQATKILSFFISLCKPQKTFLLYLFQDIFFFVTYMYFGMHVFGYRCGCCSSFHVLVLL